ncbi:helix-turn-helix transcriptional regulator [Bacillus sp. FJAT-45037]|uniref:helix-turn-helix transcriptional regulator n=1 Tax=Bacillus sp. FJAT-45037 TaxID=2011007 RepID=UPI0012FE3A5E|nr:LuxR C-terminal-related transcriptional regulator [Bacillus sp. FJAT-45037]
MDNNKNSTTAESLSFITTDPSLISVMKNCADECKQSTPLHYHIVNNVDDVRNYMKRLRRKGLAHQSSHHKFIWIISKQEQELVDDILAFNQASIVSIENSELNQSIKYAINYYPFLDIPFQNRVLTKVFKRNQGRIEHGLTVCLEHEDQFNKTEKDIITYLLQGKSAEQIAKCTYHSTHTVNNNIVKIKRKLKVESKIGIITHFVKQYIS